MNKTTHTKAFFAKLVGFMLVVYVALFYALPAGFFIFKTAQQFKNRPIIDAGYELSEGYDFENRTEPNPNEGNYLAFSSFYFNEATVSCQNCSLFQTALHTKQSENDSIFSLNCSFLFYG